MVGMERLHTKQQNGWKRKVEEDVAVNKRFKDALTLQISVQKKYGNMSSTLNVQNWLAQELEVMYSIIDAERTLNQLIEVRSILNEQLTALFASGNILEDEKCAAEEEVKQLVDNISARNAQISDLQQKILDSDQEYRSITRWDCIQSLSEAKCALKYLFDAAVELRREKTYIENKMEELQVECKTKENTNREQEKKIKEKIQNHQQEVIRLEKEHEEKLFVLLKRLPGVGDAGTFNEVLEQLFKRQERLEELESMVHKMAEEIKCLNLSSQLNITLNYDLEDSDIEEQENDNTTGDSDWQRTPIFRRIRSMRVKNCNDEEEKRRAVKRTSDGKPKCVCEKGRSSTKHCGCCKDDNYCSSARKCSVAACCNREESAHDKCESVNDENVPDTFKKLRELSLYSADELSF